MPILNSQIEITEILYRINQGELAAWEELMREVYPKLCSAAAMQREIYPNASDTMSTQEVVHEAFLSLYYSQQIEWGNRTHFYLTAARAMRYILLNQQRDKNRFKRSGSYKHVEFDDEEMMQEDNVYSFEELEMALSKLEKKHPRASLVVQLRFFIGLTENEIAELLEVSGRTVIRDWILARTLIAKTIEELRIV